uniref:O-fucosyltransferase family protein n=1 Tax=Moniliophthora roreri TaxID=221103 RepID=A0A0W0FWE9_MONRR
MLAHKITARAREASASPSVSLEKGRYRMRAPSNRPATINETIHTRPRSMSRPSSTQNSFYVVTLLLLLASACLACFGFAYYLFTTRWASRLSVYPQILADNVSQVIDVEALQLDHECPTISPREKFLVYHTHSGFHNQRISLENALTLSHLLNRTLIIPPVRLGKPIRYCNYDALHSHLALSDKSGLKHCSRILPDSFVPPECSGYYDYTHISWDWLVNLTEMESQFRFVLRQDPTDEWLHRCLGISDSQVLSIQESNRYHYRFLDMVASATGPSDKYSKGLSISHLSASREVLLQFGTLFGTTRLHLVEPKNAELRRMTRESMVFTNPLLLRVTDSISKLLGGSYVGAHIRMGDGVFLRSGEDNARVIWSTLVYRVLGLGQNDTMSLKTLLSDVGVPLEPKLTSAPFTDHPFMFELSAPPIPFLSCRKKPHSHPSLQLLNVPLFLATDTRDPHTHPSLAIFFHAFPCTFTLADFPKNSPL